MDQSQIALIYFNIFMKKLGNFIDFVKTDLFLVFLVVGSFVKSVRKWEIKAEDDMHGNRK